MTLTVTMLLLGQAFAMRAENVTKKLDLNSFNGIEAMASCEITIEESESYGAELSCGSEFQDYIEVYVKNNLLIVDMNTKAMPAELKKIWKTKDMREPQFFLTVKAPSLEQIELSGDAHLVSRLGAFRSERFMLSLAGRAKASGLVLNSSKASIKLTGNASAELSAACDSLFVEMSGSGLANITSQCGSAIIKASKSSSLTMNGNADSVDLVAAGGCAANLLGTECNDYSLKIEGGASCYVSGNGRISLEMKGSRLYFKGEPLFSVIRLSNASVEPYTEE